jgi:hypothetical protein
MAVLPSRILSMPDTRVAASPHQPLVLSVIPWWIIPFEKIFNPSVRCGYMNVVVNARRASGELGYHVLLRAGPAVMRDKCSMSPEQRRVQARVHRLYVVINEAFRFLGALRGVGIGFVGKPGSIDGWRRRSFGMYMVIVFLHVDIGKISSA